MTAEVIEFPDRIDRLADTLDAMLVKEMRENLTLRMHLAVTEGALKSRGVLSDTQILDLISHSYEHACAALEQQKVEA